MGTRFRAQITPPSIYVIARNKFTGAAVAGRWFDATNPVNRLHREIETFVAEFLDVARADWRVDGFANFAGLKHLHEQNLICITAASSLVQRYGRTLGYIFPKDSGHLSRNLLEAETEVAKDISLPERRVRWRVLRRTERTSLLFACSVLNALYRRRGPYIPYELAPVSVSPGVLRCVRLDDIANALLKHHMGHWGEVNTKQRLKNGLAVLNKWEVVSLQRNWRGVGIKLVTSAERQITRVALEHE